MAYLRATITWLDPLRAPETIEGEKYRIEKSNLEILTPLEGAESEEFGDIDILPLKNIRRIKIARRP